MRFLGRFAHFWYDFIVGDDWRLALGVVIAVPLAYAAAHDGVNAWWLMPIAVTALLTASVVHAARRANRADRAADLPDRAA